jgi:hypothetical protein
MSSVKVAYHSDNVNTRHSKGSFRASSRQTGAPDVPHNTFQNLHMFQYKLPDSRRNNRFILDSWSVNTDIVEEGFRML